MADNPLKPESAITFVTGSKTTGHLLRMLSQQQTLLEQVRSVLPSPVDSHCLHARISNNQLILHTDSSAWMTRLRFHGPQLLKALQSQAPQLRAVKTRIHIDAPAHRHKQERKKIPHDSAVSIREIALSVSDQKLRAALLRLGKTGNRD